jgi:hypothetical protein
MSKYIVFYIIISLCWSNVVCCQSANLFLANWNCATIRAIESNISASNDSIEKEYQINRLASFRAFQGVNNCFDSSNQSTRYKFYNSLRKHIADDKSYYIVETIESSSKVILKNYIIAIDSSKRASISVYIYSYDGWTLYDFFTIELSTLCNLDRNFKCKFKLGVNYDDLIVTRLNGYSIMYSDYFLFSSLASESWLGTVLNGAGQQHR